VSVVGDAPLRAWPSRTAPAAEVVRSGGFVTLEGPGQPPWLKVRTTAGRTGWIAGEIVNSVLEADEGLAERPTRLDGFVRLFTAVELRTGPTAGRPVAHRLAEGATVRVLDQWGTWVLLGDQEGRSGWAELTSFVAGEVAQPPPAPAPAERSAEADEPAGARDAAAPERGGEEEDARQARLEAKAAKQREREAARRERLEEKEAKRLEREEARRAALANEEARRLAEEEEARAAAPAEEPARQVAAAEQEAAVGSADEVEAAPDDESVDLDRAARRAAREEEKRRLAAEREAEKEREAAEKAAEKQRIAEERAAEKAARAAEKAAEKAARRARKGEREGAVEEEAAPRREAEPAAVAAGPVAPADIPPSLGVTLDKKAPAEKKPDPSASPLLAEGELPPPSAGEPVVEPLPAAPEPARPELLEGFRPYDEQRQLDRSVEGVHSDAEEALDLSFAPRPTARGRAFYVNEAGEVVDTTIVSEIVLRVGTEILTRDEFERRLGETRERERARGGPEPSMDDLRKQVLRDLVNDLVLVHHGRAIGVRFDAVYESAKEEFKKSGGITDDLELLRLLDEMGMTFKDFRREMVRRTVPGVVIRSQVMSEVTVPDDEIENYYRRHQDEWSEEDCVLLRELVLQPEARETTRDFNLRLEEILTRADAGEDFCDLARRHSRSPSASDCGRLESCFAFDQLDEKVARIVFRMRPGDIEPVRTEWGYHLLLLDEHRPSRVRTLEEVRSQILRSLQREKLSVQIPRFLEDLRKSVRIEVAPSYRRYWEELYGSDGLGQ
jgi:parvulin-like peptidyl-prolyl isomerase